MTIQAIATLISAIGIAGMICVFLFVLSRSSPQRAYEEVQPRAYGIRKAFFIVLLVGFFAVPAFTLRHLPYAVEDESARVVDVVAHQWYWEVSSKEFQVGEEVLFRVGSEDVNHGFGVYDDSTRLIAQVQAMPGYVNELAVRFERAGTYRIMCLEYCGLAHHGMLVALTVTAEKESL